MKAVFVYGACVRNGEWWWRPTADLLANRGTPSAAPALSSCGETGVPGGAGGPGLPEKVATVRQVLQNGDEPTVVLVVAGSDLGL